MVKIENGVPKAVQKYFSSAISGIKSQRPNFLGSTSIWIFHGRKLPKSVRLSTVAHFLTRYRRRHLHNHQHQESKTDADFDRHSAAATLDDIDRYLIENFGSLYGNNENVNQEVEEEVAELDDAHSSPEIPLPPLIDLRGSNRFFINPVSSGSLIEEARTKSEDSRYESLAVTAAKTSRVNVKFSANIIENPNWRSGTLNDCVAVVTASASPYEDFMQSMMDMMKAGAKHGRRIDWEFMEELLFSYLRLNEKEHYRFVLRAFVDLMADLRQISAGDGQRTAGTVGKDL